MKKAINCPLTDFLIIALVSVFLISSEAHAYIDPGTGSILIQAIVGGIIGFFVILRQFGGKIFIYTKQLFRRKNN